MELTEYTRRTRQAETWAEQLVEMLQCQQRTLNNAVEELGIDLPTTTTGDRPIEAEEACRSLLELVAFQAEMIDVRIERIKAKAQGVSSCR